MESITSKQLAESLAKINARLDKIEKQVFKVAPPDKITTPETPAPQKSAPKTDAPINRPSVDHLISKSAEVSPPKQATNKGGQLLASVAVFFFFLAASLFVKLAIESGWLTPIRQFGGVVLFGFGLLGSGVILHKKDAPYSGFLTGAGVAMLYFAAYVGCLYFRLYDYKTAILFGSIIGSGSILLFTKLGHEYFLLAAVAGSYLPPLLFLHQQFSLMEVGCYMLLVAPVFCAFAFLLKSRMLMIITAYFGVLLFHYVVVLTLEGSFAKPSDPQIGAWVQGLQFMLFTVSVTAFSVVNQLPLTKVEAWSTFPVLLLFYSSEYHLLSLISPEAAPWIALVFAGVLVALYFGARLSLEGKEFESGPMVTAFVAVILAHSGYLELLPANSAPFVVIALILCLHSKIFGELKFSDHWITYLILYGISFLEYVKVLLGSDHLNDSTIFTGRCLFALVLALGYFVGRTEKSDRGFLLWLAMLQALFALTKVASALAGANDIYVTSGLWSLLALGMLFAAVAIKDRVLGRSAAGLFLIVAAKVFFVDIASHGTVTKIITLLVVGTIIFIGGYYLRVLNEDSSS